MSKIGVGLIIKAHWASLYNNQTHRPDWGDVLLFFVLPLLAAIGLRVFPFHAGMEDSLRSALLTSVSVLAGLLLNMLVLLLDGVQNAKEQHPTRLDFIREIHANLTFDLLVSIACLLLIVSTYFVENGWARTILDTGVYTTFLCFVLTLLMVLKRIFALFGRLLKDSQLSE